MAPSKIEADEFVVVLMDMEAETKEKDLYSQWVDQAALAKLSAPSKFEQDIRAQLDTLSSLASVNSEGWPAKQVEKRKDIRELLDCLSDSPVFLDLPSVRAYEASLSTRTHDNPTSNDDGGKYRLLFR